MVWRPQVGEAVICTASHFRYIAMDEILVISDVERDGKLLHFKGKAGGYLKYNFEPLEYNMTEVNSRQTIDSDHTYIIIRKLPADVTAMRAMINSLSRNNAAGRIIATAASFAEAEQMCRDIIQQNPSTELVIFYQHSVARASRPTVDVEFRDH